MSQFRTDISLDRVETTPYSDGWVTIHHVGRTATPRKPSPGPAQDRNDGWPEGTDRVYLDRFQPAASADAVERDVSGWPADTDNTYLPKEA